MRFHIEMKELGKALLWGAVAALLLSLAAAVAWGQCPPGGCPNQFSPQPFVPQQRFGQIPPRSAQYPPRTRGVPSAQAPQDIPDCIVEIRPQAGRGKPLGGFVLGHAREAGVTLVATAGHVGGGAQNAMGTFRDGSQRTLEIVAQGDNADLLVLKCDLVDVPAADLVDARLGQSILVYGYSTQRLAVRRGLVQQVGQILLHTSAGCWPGDSGAAICNTDGQVVGMLCESNYHEHGRGQPAWGKGPCAARLRLGLSRVMVSICPRGPRPHPVPYRVPFQERPPSTRIETPQQPLPPGIPPSLSQADVIRGEIGELRKSLERAQATLDALKEQAQRTPPDSDPIPGPAGKDGRDGKDGKPGSPGSPGRDGANAELSDQHVQEISAIVLEGLWARIQSDPRFRGPVGPRGPPGADAKGSIYYDIRPRAGKNSN